VKPSVDVVYSGNKGGESGESSLSLGEWGDSYNLCEGGEILTISVRAGDDLYLSEGW